MQSYTISLLLFACIAAVATAASTEEKYTTKYDNIDLDEILNNERLYKKYLDCLLNKGKCTTDGLELKKILPDALATECKKCNEKQKDGAEKVLKFMLEKKGEDYKELEKQYDPEGIYKKKYSADLEKKGIKIN